MAPMKIAALTGQYWIAHSVNDTSNTAKESPKKIEHGASVSHLQVEAKGSGASKCLSSISKPESSVEGPADTLDEPTFENALAFAANLSIPHWLAPEDDGGVASGLECKYGK